jgi:hypothetical protein
LLLNAKELDQYEVIEESPDVFVIYLMNGSGVRMASIEKKFPSKLNSEDHINELIAYFEKLIEKGSKDLNLRYQRLGSRTADDFNFRLSIVYPNWTEKFNRKSYVKLFRKIVFDCLPAHLTAHLVGLDFDQMSTFEKLYFDYLDQLKKDPIETRLQRLSASNKILDLLIANDRQ